MSNDKQDEEMICALTADEHVALLKGLRALPETMPPREIWKKIRSQATAEGLLQAPPASRKKTWYLGAGLAAAALLAAIVIPVVQQPADNLTVVPRNTMSNTADLSSLRALMVQSQQLESDLRSLPAEPRVARAGTVATLSDIEDRIAAVDYQLNDPESRMTADDRQIFWRERVRLMKLLVQLRFAQAQRTAY